GAHRAFLVGTTHKALWRYYLRPRWKFDFKLRFGLQVALRPAIIIHKSLSRNTLHFGRTCHNSVWPTMLLPFAEKHNVFETRARSRGEVRQRLHSTTVEDVRSPTAVR